MHVQNLTQTTSNGVSYDEKTGSSSVIEIDISSIPNNASGAAQLVQAIVEATGTSTSFDSHREEYAYNTSEPTKLYMYDNDLSISQYSAQRTTWEPEARDEQGYNENLDYTAKNGTIRYIEDYDLKIQASANAFEAIQLIRPLMTLSTLGFTSLNVLDHEAASGSLDIVTFADAYVSSKRSYLGAMQNRLEHAQAVDSYTSENTQSAERRLRDTDMASMMVQFSKYNILQQAGQSMLAQANQSKQDVLQLFQ